MNGTGVTRLATLEPVVVFGEGVSAGRFVGEAAWLLLDREADARRTVEVLHLASGRRRDLTPRVGGGWAGAPHAPLVAFEEAGRSAPDPGSRVVLLDLRDEGESVIELPHDAERLSFQGQWLVCVPAPAGTLRVPGDPMVIDLTSREMRSLEGDADEGDVDRIGAHHAVVLDAGRVVFAVNRHVGLCEEGESAEEGRTTRKRLLSRHPYPIEGVVADPGASWFAAWDAGGNVRWYGATAASETHRELFAYGAPAQASCVVPTRSGTWTFVGDALGGIAAFQTGPTDSVHTAPDWGESRLTLYAGDNYGWTALLQLDPHKPVVEMLESGIWLGPAALATRVRELDLISGERREVQRAGEVYEEALFRLSSTERGWDDLTAPGLHPEADVLPVYVASQRQVERRAVPSGTRSFAVSSDGVTLAFQDEEALVTVSSGSRMRSITVGRGEVLAGIASGGRLLATLEPEESAFLLYRLDAASPPHRIRVESLREARRGQGVSFSPAGERLACWIDPATIGVFDTGHGRMLLSLDVSPAYPGGDVRFSPDGHLLWTKRSVRLSSLGRDTYLVLWCAGTPLQFAHGIRPATQPR